MEQSAQVTKKIQPIEISALKGRMLRVVAPKAKKTEMLLLYGHHASLERMFGVAEALSRYAEVTMPDLPGFGGMDSFYSIGKKPTLDNFADYLYTFVKWRYKKRQFTIAATSFSFLVVTRMLDKYPEMKKQVQLIVCFMGFLHHDAFILSKKMQISGKIMGAMFSTKPLAWFAKTFVLRKTLITYAYNRAAHTHAKMKDAEDEDELKRRVAFEVMLWTNNDIRTHMYTQRLMLRVNLLDIRIPDVSVHYVGTMNDHFFDMNIIEQHLKVVYKRCTFAFTSLKAHAPTVIATAEDAKSMLPPKTLKILRALSQ
jgi:pimeloyl-ACP methyl ester carboxylesterase